MVCVCLLKVPKFVSFENMYISASQENILSIIILSFICRGQLSISFHNLVLKFQNILCNRMRYFRAYGKCCKCISDYFQLLYSYYPKSKLSSPYNIVIKVLDLYLYISLHQFYIQENTVTFTVRYVDHFSAVMDVTTYQSCSI